MKMLGESSLRELQRLIDRYPELNLLHHDLIKAVQMLKKCYTSGGKLLICGNGGSASDSLHMVGELMKGFTAKRRIPSDLQEEVKLYYPDMADYYIAHLQSALPAISLVSETSLMTAYGNDEVSELIFAQQLLGYGRRGDVLLGISTSGNSKNVLHAAKISKVLGIGVISLTGRDGGALKSLSDVVLAVPSEVTYQVQEYHLPVYHAICLALEAEFFT